MSLADKVIVGQSEVIEQVLIAIFAGGHALLEGVPGLAKTLLISSIAQSLHLTFKRIQFSPDLMPSDVTGTDVLQEDPETGRRHYQFLPGPLFANMILAARFGRRQIVMIFSDFLTDLSTIEAPLQRLRYDRHEVVVFQVMDHDELTFDLSGMTRFVGLESDEHGLAQPDDLKRGYLAALSRHNRNVEQICVRNQIEYLQADTSRDIGEFLSDYLHRRSLLNRGR